MHERTNQLRVETLGAPIVLVRNASERRDAADANLAGDMIPANDKPAGR